MKSKNTSSNLILECEVEELTQEQSDYYDRCEKNYELVKKKIGKYMNNCSSVIESSDEISVLECFVNGDSNNQPKKSTPQLTVIKPNALKNIDKTKNNGPKKNTPILPGPSTPYTSSTPGSTYYVMDPNLGVLVGTLGDSGGMVTVRNDIQQPNKIPLVPRSDATGQVQLPRTYTRAKKVINPPNQFIRVTNPTEIKKIHSALQSSNNANMQQSKGIKISNVQSILRQNQSPKSSSASPSNVVNQKTSQSSVPELSDVAFTRNCGKTFPSLVVCAKPCLNKNSTRLMSPSEREALDAKVKSVLMFTPSKFTEWLIQLGLVRSQQSCHVHFDGDGPIKLKLGIYSDSSRFPYSGGYVWISSCCPSNFVSVFTGSIFDEAPYPPSILIKLIYHWACQTNIQNIVQWVKVETSYIKTFFTLMRSICTAAVHDKSILGGHRKKVELGVISLGTTTAQGNSRHVKVEVVGMLDCTTNVVRLCACDPHDEQKDPNDPTGKKRFLRILEHLPKWLDQRSLIYTDYTIDRSTLISLGYSNVIQTQLKESSNDQPVFGNKNIMEYLRRIVPKMFQNTLSMLSIQIIQQFLDELSWRERWGPQPPQAFENILQHISQLTRIEHENLLNRLNRISVNPFRNWAYSKMITPNEAKSFEIANPPTEDTPNILSPIVEINDDISSPSTNNFPVSSIDMLPPSIKDVDPPSSKSISRISSNRNKKRPAESQITPSKTKQRKFGNIIENMKYPNDCIKTVEEYYYAQVDGDQSRMAPLKRVLQPEHIACVQCNVNFPNNITLMRHLSLHARNKQVNLNPSLICKYCLKEARLPSDLKNHIDQVHKRIHNSICRICHLPFTDDYTMVQHMKRIHVYHEMPYECKICKFKSSLLINVIDHYYANHINLDTILCPFCLKILMLHDKNGKIQSSNIRYYIAHLDKHIQNRVNSCRKCLLKFVNHEEVKRHLIEDHQPTMDDNVDMKKIKEKLEQACISLSVCNVSKSSKSQEKSKKNDLDMSSICEEYISVPPWVNLKIKYEPWKLQCFECQLKPLNYNHFKTYHSCRKCEYSTFCETAMIKHQTNFHGNKRETINSPRQKYFMICNCGFKSRNGDKLAKHLIKCSHPSKFVKLVTNKVTEKHSATFPPLVSIDDDELSQSGWINYPQDKVKNKEPETSKEKGPQSMLNILGLVRKSTDETSSEKGLSDID